MDLVVKYVLSHQQYLYGLATGYAVSHVPQAVAFLFHQAMRLPLIRAAVVADPARSKELIRQIEAELERDIDAEAAVPAAPPQVPPVP